MSHLFVLLRSDKQIVESSNGALYSFFLQWVWEGKRVVCLLAVTVVGWAARSSREFIGICCLVIKSESEQFK